MTDTNAKLAEALEWAEHDQSGHLWTMPDGRTAQTAAGPLYRMPVVMALFSVDLNAFHTHVLPELERRGLGEAWAEKVAELVGVELIEMASCSSDCDSPNYTGLAACLSAPASVLCEAALAVMGGGE